MAQRIPARLSAREGRKFAFTVGLAFLLFAGIAAWRSHRTLTLMFASIGGLLLIAGLAIPSRLGPVERAWMALAHFISRFTTPVIMGVIYYGVITPIGLIMRAFGSNPLTHASNGQSYLAWRNGAPRSDLHRQF